MTTKRFASGLVGAAALTTLNEGVRRARGDAPRLDRLGMRAIAALAESVLGRRLSERTLYGASLVGDVASNTAYYATLLERSSGAWSRMLIGGLGAGLGALIVPEALGKGQKRSKVATQVMTVAWYAAGALAAAGVFHLLTRSSSTTNVRRAGPRRRL